MTDDNFNLIITQTYSSKDKKRGDIDVSIQYWSLKIINEMRFRKDMKIHCIRPFIYIVDAFVDIFVKGLKLYELVEDPKWVQSKGRMRNDMTVMEYHIIKSSLIT